MRSAFEDVATPFEPFTGKEESSDCKAVGLDGFQDLTLKFDRQAVVDALGKVEHGEVRIVALDGKLSDGTPIVGEDVVVILKPGRYKTTTAKSKTTTKTKKKAKKRN